MVHSQLMFAMLVAYVFIIFSEVAESNQVSEAVHISSYLYRSTCKKQYLFASR